jgi:recombination protein RecT
MDSTNALSAKTSTPVATIKQYLEQPAVAAGLAKACAGFIRPELLCRAAYTMLTRTPALQKCTPESVYISLMDAALAGQPLILGRGYLVPYGNECKFMPGYLTLIDLMLKHPKVLSVWAEAVYEKDDFDYELGDSPFIRHKPEASEDRGELAYAYACARLAGDVVARVVLPAAEVLKHRAASKAWQRDRERSIWGEWEEQMWKKTAIIALSKFVPMSIEALATIQQATDADSALHAAKDVTPKASPFEQPPKGNAVPDPAATAPTEEECRKYLESAVREAAMTTDAFNAICRRLYKKDYPALGLPELRELVFTVNDWMPITKKGA